MSNDLSNLLGNNTNMKVRPNIKIDNANSLFKSTIFDNTETNYKNRVQNTVNYTKNTIITTTKSFNKLSTTMKVLLLFGTLFIIFLIGLIIKYYREQRLKETFANQPIFMTGIEHNEPHNTEQIFRYIEPNTGKATSYIPGYNFNETNGQQYTFSFWMFIDGKRWDYRFGEWKHIFHRGTAPETDGDMGGENVKITKLINQLPGFWISPKENKLNCVITTRTNEERLTIDDIPINKWMNIVVTIDNTSVSLYKDGLLHRTIILMDRINSSKDAVYVNYFGGFAGKMAYLQFFNRVLTPTDIMKLYQEYKVNIDKYIKYMFNNAVNRSKLPIVPSQNSAQCNYLDYIKQEKDKTDIKDQIVKTYQILCQNTKDKTVADCKKGLDGLNNFLVNVPGPNLREMLNNIVNSVKPIEENEYEYSGINGNKEQVFLTKDEYQKIKNILL